MRAKKERKISIWKLMWKQRQIQAFVWAGLLFLLIFNYIPVFNLKRASSAVSLL